MRYWILRIVKRLLNRDFVILKINNEDTKRLGNNNHLVEVLGDNIKMIIKIYNIIINGVKIKDFEIINKSYAIEYIKAYNTDLKTLHKIDIK